MNMPALLTPCAAPAAVLAHQRRDWGNGMQSQGVATSSTAAVPTETPQASQTAEQAVPAHTATLAANP
jgi:hypothetical protein